MAKFECEYSKETNRCKKNTKMTKSDENCEKSIETNRCKKSKVVITDSKTATTKSKTKTKTKVEPEMLSYFEKFYSTNNIYHITLEKNTIKYLKNKYGYYDKTIQEDRVGNYKKYGIYKDEIPLDPSLHDKVTEGSKNIEYDYILNSIPHLIPNVQENDMVYVNVGNYSRGEALGGKDFNLYTVKKHFRAFRVYETMIFFPHANLEILNGLLKKYGLLKKNYKEIYEFYNQYGIREIKKLKLKHTSYKTVKKSDDLEKAIKHWKERAETYIKDVNERYLEGEKRRIEYYNEMKQKKMQNPRNGSKNMNMKVKILLNYGLNQMKPK